MNDLTDFLLRHERTVLLLSAGKDSAACLKMLRPHLSNIMVMWVNPGHPYPETLEYMSRIQRSVPHFQMVHGNQREFVAHHGHPADVMPFEAMPLGRVISRSSGPKLVPLEHCCNANMWMPARRALRDYGATGCIRGDKEADPLHSDVASGTTFEGVEYLFPLLAWSDREVFDYLGDDVPPSYAKGMISSLDCMNCTAYLAENRQRLVDLREHHPETWAEVGPVIQWMRDAARRHVATLEE